MSGISVSPLMYNKATNSNSFDVVMSYANWCCIGFCLHNVKLLLVGNWWKYPLNLMKLHIHLWKIEYRFCKVTHPWILFWHKQKTKLNRFFSSRFWFAFSWQLACHQLFQKILQHYSTQIYNLTRVQFSVLASFPTRTVSYNQILVE